MKRYLLHLSYFGTRYRGFQKQNYNGDPQYNDPHTICGLLEIALKTCGPSNYPSVVPSSRTDKGVHALCNTVHVDLEECSSSKVKLCSQTLAYDLNGFFEYNDHDIRVLKVQQVDPDFHCRFKAVGRQYLYRVAVPKLSVPYRNKKIIPSPVTELNRCHFLQNPVFDTDAISSACSIFVGTKDFGALCSRHKERGKEKQKSTVRSIESLRIEPASPLLPSPQLAEEYDFWHFYCSGKSFLYHQVRRMVSALVIYGQGRVSLSDVQRLVDEPIDKSWECFGFMLPPHGLYLVDVRYLPADLIFVDNSVKDDIRKLEDELAEAIDSVRNFKGSVLEKIERRRAILEIHNRLLVQKQQSNFLNSFKK